MCLCIFSEILWTLRAWVILRKNSYITSFTKGIRFWINSEFHHGEVEGGYVKKMTKSSHMSKTNNPLFYKLFLMKKRLKCFLKLPTSISTLQRNYGPVINWRAKQVFLKIQTSEPRYAISQQPTSSTFEISDLLLIFDYWEIGLVFPPSKSLSQIDRNFRK